MFHVIVVFYSVIVIFNQQFLLVPTNHIQKRLTNHFSVKFFIVLYPLKPVGTLYGATK